MAGPKPWRKQGVVVKMEKVCRPGKLSGAAAITTALVNLGRDYCRFPHKSEEQTPPAPTATGMPLTSNRSFPKINRLAAADCRECPEQTRIDFLLQEMDRTVGKQEHPARLVYAAKPADAMQTFF